jgi:hypothetical protein
MAFSTVSFFPVGDIGGMILLKIKSTSSLSILVDCCISDTKIADHCDVVDELYKRLPRDSEDRPYVDAFILTHRHEDHIRGFSTYFHLGPVSDYKSPKEDELPKIVINELWSSDLFSKPESKNYPLCDEAKAFNKEVKRRIELYKEKKLIQTRGNRVIIIGAKTEGLESITYEIGSRFDTINTVSLSGKLSGLILSPIAQQEDELDEDFFEHNRQSIVIQLTFNEDDNENQIMLAADADCMVWETLWTKYKSQKSDLAYDLLLAPHHCSWHSLSYDSQSECDDPKVNERALKALSQNKDGAYIVSQSKPITDEDSDPPSTAAKAEYVKLVGKDHFYCTDEYPNEKTPEPLEFNLTKEGMQIKPRFEKSKLSTASIASSHEAYPHG